MEDRLKHMHHRKTKEDQPSAATNPHHNVDFTFASAAAAAVKRLWIIANSVLSNCRRSMTPQMLSRHFWDDALVVQAIHAAKTDQFNARKERKTSEKAILA